MTLEEIYDLAGGNFNEAAARLGGEERLKRFLKMLSGDDSITTFEKAVDDGRMQEAFRAAHTIKGICLNLGFKRIAATASVLCDALRGSEEDNCAPPIEDIHKEAAALKKEYGRVLEMINQITETDK